jgi:hypothetical protein
LVEVFKLLYAATTNQYSIYLPQTPTCLPSIFNPFFFGFVVSEPFYVCSWGIYLNDLKDTKRVGFGVYFNHEFLTKIKTQPFLAYPKYP